MNDSMNKAINKEANDFAKTTDREISNFMYIHQIPRKKLKNYTIKILPNKIEITKNKSNFISQLISKFRGIKEESQHAEFNIKTEINQDIAEALEEK